MRARHAIAPVIALAALASGCRTAGIVVPAGLDTTAPLAVRGLNPRMTGTPIGFGPYRATVREGWETSRSVELLGIGVGKAMRPYRLELAGGETAVTAACATAAAELWRGSFSVELPVEAVLACTITGAGSTAELRLTADRNGALSGSLRSPGGGPGLEARSLHALAGAAWRVVDPVGFELRRDGEAVAAAEVVNAGRVWLSASLDAGERDTVAAAMTALLFFTPPEVRR